MKQPRSLEKGCAVRGRGVRSAPREDPCIAGHLTIETRGASGLPDEGIEPVKALREGEKPVHGEIPAACVPHLVQEDPA